jgi:hypothetical protein
VYTVTVGEMVVLGGIEFVGRFLQQENIVGAGSVMYSADRLCFWEIMLTS